jgi:putative redox protein
MDQYVKLQHEEDLSFNVQIDGHNFKIDSLGEFGGKNRGPRPKTLMLAALGGCTGMDVASIMKKMKIPYEDFSVEVTGVLTDEHPKHFKKMHITYTVKGKDLDRSKIEKAVDLSQDRYCGVTHNYKASMEISHEIIIEE